MKRYSIGLIALLLAVMLLPIGTALAAPVAQDEAPTAVTVTARSNNLNLRSGPGTGYSRVGVLPRGETANAIGRNRSGSWAQVQYQGVTGWVAAYLTSINGNLTSLPDTTPATSSSGSSGGASSGGYATGGQTHSLANPATMHSAGMTWVKFQVKWAPGMDPSSVADRIAAARANGFRVLLSIPGDLYPSSIDYNAYVEFLRGVAAYGPDAIEIWNEQNFDTEWPTGQINPASYVTNMLAPAYTAIKSVNPAIMVISGAPTPTGVHNITSVWSDDIYVAGMRDAGAERYADCMGIHFNGGATSPSASSGHPADDGRGHYSWYYSKQFAIYSATFRNKPLCYTEIGFVSPEGYGNLPPNFWWGFGTSANEQAQWLAEASRMARQSGRVRLFIVFNVDIPHYGDDPQAGYAILRPGGACPACSLLAASLR